MLINWPRDLAPIERIEVRLLSLPTRASLAAAHDNAPADARELAVVAMTTEDGVTGWGECSALTRGTYWHETARSSYDGLSAFRIGDESSDDATPMAEAALEMAALDAHLRAKNLSFAQHVGAVRLSFPAGAVVGLGDITVILNQIGELVEAGINRVKLKIQPGHDVDVVHAVRVEWPHVEIHVDANGAYGRDGVPTMYRLKALGVSVFEQPFDWRQNDVELNRKLIRTGATVIADEAIDSVDALLRYVDTEAISALAIKPSRLGGVSNTLAMLRIAEDSGLGVSAGGMLESGLGRHLLAGLAARPEFTIVGDVSPARRWLAEDPWPDLQLLDGEIITPTEVGIAPLPDLDLLDRFTIARSVTPN